MTATPDFHEVFGLQLGDRVELVSMTNDPCPIEAGAQGTVDWLNDVLYPQVGVKWDNGRSLMLIPGTDRWKRVIDHHDSARYALQTLFVPETNRWQLYRPEMGSYSAALMFLERLPDHLLPARIVDAEAGQVIEVRGCDHDWAGDHNVHDDGLCACVCKKCGFPMEVVFR